MCGALVHPLERIDRLSLGKLGHENTSNLDAAGLALRLFGADADSSDDGSDDAGGGTAGSGASGGSSNGGSSGTGGSSPQEACEPPRCEVILMPSEIPPACS